MKPILPFRWKTALLSLFISSILCFYTWYFLSLENGPLHVSAGFSPANILGDAVCIFLVALLVYAGLRRAVSRYPVLMPLLVLFAFSFLPLFLYYFWHTNEPLKVDSQISFMEVVIAIISLTVITWGGYIAVRQLQISAHANRMSVQTNQLAAFQCMIGILQNDAARQRRARIFRLFDDKACRLRKPLAAWSEQERRDVHDALADFDQIGLMVRNGLLNYTFLESWDYSTYKILHIARELIEEEERKYSHHIRTPEGDVRRSNYYLGLAELLDRKKLTFDFEMPPRTEAPGSKD